MASMSDSNEYRLLSAFVTRPTASPGTEMRIAYDIELRESFEGLCYAYFCRLACVGRERHGDVARTGLVVLKFSGKEDVRLCSLCRCRVDGSNPVGKRKPRVRSWT